MIINPVSANNWWTRNLTFVIGEQNVKKFEAENFSHLHSVHYPLTRIVRQRRTPRIIHVELIHSDTIFINTWNIVSILSYDFTKRNQLRSTRHENFHKHRLETTPQKHRSAIASSQKEVRSLSIRPCKKTPRTSSTRPTLLPFSAPHELPIRLPPNCEHQFSLNCIIVVSQRKPKRKRFSHQDKQRNIHANSPRATTLIDS